MKRIGWISAVVIMLFVCGGSPLASDSCALGCIDPTNKQVFLDIGGKRVAVVDARNTNNDVSALIASPNGHFLAIELSRNENIIYDDDSDGGIERYFSFVIIDVASGKQIYRREDSAISFKICGWRNLSALVCQANTLHEVWSDIIKINKGQAKVESGGSDIYSECTNLLLERYGE